MLDMKDTGTKMTTRLSVVARTAVEGPNVYQLGGGYPPPLKKPLGIVLPPGWPHC